LPKNLIKQKAIMVAAMETADTKEMMDDQTETQIQMELEAQAVEPEMEMAPEMALAKDQVKELEMADTVLV